MKKQKKTFHSPIIYLITGIILLAIFFAEIIASQTTKYNFGSNTTLLFMGIINIWQYTYWSNPDHEEKFLEKTEKEDIKWNDERVLMLRDRAIRYAFWFGVILLGVAYTVLDIMIVIWEYPWISMYRANAFIGLFFIIELVAYAIIFKFLLWKY